MNRLHSDVQIEVTAPVAMREASRAAECPRLVVVMREVEEEALLAGRIQELARARGLPVLLVGIARDTATEASLRRSLVTIAAFLKEGNGRFAHGARPNPAANEPEIRIEQSWDWIKKVRGLLRPGDLLACYSGEKTGLLERPLSDALSNGLGTTVYTFTGLRADGVRRQSRLVQLASWAGSLASIAAFLLLQARIVLAVQGWLQSVLLLITLAAEVAVVWFVNSLIAQI